MAFWVAGGVLILGFGWALLLLFASGMSDNMSAAGDMRGSVITTVVVTVLVAVAIVASHYVHWSW